MKKLVVLFLVLVSFFTVVAYADEEVQPEGVIAVVHSNTLALREEPSTSAKRIEQLQNGDAVVIPVDERGNVYRSGDFLYTWFDNDYGWILEKLVTKNPRYMVSGDKNTRVYASPSMAVEVTDHLDANEQILILEELENGYVVNFRKTAGFVRRDANLYFAVRTGQDSMEYLTERMGVLNDEEEFYAEPHEDAYEVVKCEKGQPIKVIGEANGYYKAIWEKQLIYVEQDDVDLY